MVNIINKDNNLHIAITEEITTESAQIAIDTIYGAEHLDNITSIVVGINSYGGSVIAANDIINACKKSTKRVVSRMEGVAASAAFLIWLSCPEREIADNAIGMIHDPSNADPSTLEVFRQSISKYLADNCSIPQPTIENMMTNETWMNPKEMVNMGFTSSDKVYKNSAKTKFSPMNIINQLLTMVKPQSKNDTNIYDCKEIKDDMEITELKNKVDSLQSELDITKAEFLAALDKVQAYADKEQEAEKTKQDEEKSKILNDAGIDVNNAAWMQLPLDTVIQLTKDVKVSNVVKTQAIDVKNTNIRDYSDVKNLSALDVDQKIDLFNTNKELYFKLFNNK